MTNRKVARSALPPNTAPADNPAVPIAPLLQQALQLHGAGQAEQAKPLYERILRAAPDHFDALHLLGIAEYQSGRAHSAVTLLQRALALNPGVPAPHVNLGLALQALGQAEAARLSFERALALEPGHADAHNNLAALLLDLHQAEAALAHLEQALRGQPDHVNALNNRGNALRALLRPAEAIDSYDAAIRLAPRYHQAYFNRGNAHQDLRHYEAAIADYGQALQLQPAALHAWLNLGNALQALRHYGTALDSYAQALRLDPQCVAARLNQAHVLRALHQPQAALLAYEQVLLLQADHLDALLGRSDMLRELNRHDEALVGIERALQLHSTHAPAFNSRGLVLSAQGRLAAAQADYRRAIELAPHKGLYYRNLLHSATLAADDAHLAALRALVPQLPALAPEDRINVHFALGDALEKLGEHAASFEHYLQGNALQRQCTDYDEAAALALLDDCRSTVSAPFIHARQGMGDASDVPVFIVGMPRSGSTLIEQILASHPAVFGAGERRDFARVLAQSVAQRPPGQGELQALAALGGAQLRQLGQDYLAALGAIHGLQPQHRRIVDKSPLNFIHLGMIHLALPRARFIHTRRAPVETCLSCFSKWFDEVPFSYDLGELGRYYRAYDALMAHWRAVLPPGVMLEIQYEELIDDFDTQARRLVEHCALEWHEACGAFYRNRRAVGTVSLAQVRQPLYRHALRRWRPSDAVLQPLLEGLGPQLAGRE